MKIVDAVLTRNDCYKQGRTIMPQGIMLHSVGVNQPKASVFIKSWNQPKIEMCVHAFIDGETGIIYKTLPWTTRGWHAGRGTSGRSANNDYIGVEMCEPRGIEYTNGSRFTVIDEVEAMRSVATTYTSAVELFAYLCKAYDLNPMVQIISHSEGYSKGIASNHGDPVHLWTQLGTGYTMDKFREAVYLRLKSPSSMYGDFSKYQTLDEIPDWGKDAIKFYVANGALAGTGKGFDLTEDMLRILVINYRAFAKK